MVESPVVIKDPRRPLKGIGTIGVDGKCWKPAAGPVMVPAAFEAFVVGLKGPANADEASFASFRFPALMLPETGEAFTARCPLKPPEIPGNVPPATTVVLLLLLFTLKVLNECKIPVAVVY
jgi:hypothetical protein